MQDNIQLSLENVEDETNQKGKPNKFYGENFEKNVSQEIHSNEKRDKENENKKETENDLKFRIGVEENLFKEDQFENSLKEDQVKNLFKEVQNENLLKENLDENELKEDLDEKELKEERDESLLKKEIIDSILKRDIEDILINKEIEGNQEIVINKSESQVVNDLNVFEKEGNDSMQKQEKKKIIQIVEHELKNILITEKFKNSDFFLTSKNDTDNYHTPITKTNSKVQNKKFKSLQLEKEEKKQKIKNLNKKLLPVIISTKFKNKVKENISNQRSEREKFERKQILNSKNLTELVHEKFKQKDAEKKKQAEIEREFYLKQRKTHFKPYDYTELNKFTVKYDSRQVLLKKKIEDKVKIEKIEIKSLIPLYQKYMDDLKNKSLLENSSFIYNEEQAKKQASNKVTKMSKYSHYVKKNFLPLIQTPLANKITLIENSTEKNIIYKEDLIKADFDQRMKFKKIGKKYLETNGKKKKKENNENVPVNMIKISQYKNYLKEMKKVSIKRNLKKSLTKRIHSICIEKKTKKDMQHAFFMIHNQDDKINDFQRNKDLNQLTEKRLDSIKAKLKIIEKFN